MHYEYGYLNKWFFGGSPRFVIWGTGRWVLWGRGGGFAILLSFLIV